MQKFNSKILSVVADLRYMDGFEEIDATYTTYMKGIGILNFFTFLFMLGSLGKYLHQIKYTQVTS